MVRQLSGCVVALCLSLLAAASTFETRLEAGGRRLDPHAGAPSRPQPRAASLRSSGGSLLQRLPLMFERNEGQVDPRVKFLSRGGGYTMFLTGDETVLSLSGHRGKDDDASVRLRLIAANASPDVIGEQELPGRVSYFVGKDPTKWHSGVRTYGQVRERNVYPGVDLIYYGTEQALEFDFVVAPGADPNVIAFDVDGATPRADGDASVVLDTPAGAVRLRKPVIYQEDDGGRHEVAGGYIIAGKRVRFAVSTYDLSRRLVIDPYVTFVGGTGEDVIYGIAVDDLGAAYVTGYTNSPNFPADTLALKTPVPFPSAACTPILSCQQWVQFVAKLNPDGSNLDWYAYVGGAKGGPEIPHSIAVTGASSLHHIYVVGMTGGETDFPTTSTSLQPANTLPNTFLFRMVDNGTMSPALAYSTYLSGIQDDIAVAADSALNAYITGTTGNICDKPVTPSASPLDADNHCLPTTSGAFKSSTLGILDAFVLKIDTSNKTTGANSLVYGAVMGGKNDDRGRAIAVDAIGQASITGTTNSYCNPPDPNTPATCENPNDSYSGPYPTTAFAVQPLKPKTTGYDAFVTVLSANGSALVYSTYLGGIFDENIEGGPGGDGGIAVDIDGNVYVTGTTTSPNLAKGVVGDGAALHTGGNSQDAFLAKFNASAFANGPAPDTLAWFTYVGGNYAESGRGVAVDPGKKNPGVYVTGHVGSNDGSFLTTPGTLQPQFPNAAAGVAFMRKYNSMGQMIASTFIGGVDANDGYAIAVDGNAQAYVAGVTNSKNRYGDQTKYFPTSAGAFQEWGNKIWGDFPPELSTGNNGFVAMLDMTAFSTEVEVTKTVSIAKNYVVPGDFINYSIAVTNKGLKAATITLNDPLPTGLKFVSSAQCEEVPPGSGALQCPLGVMQPGDTKMVAITAQADNAPPLKAGLLLNCATATASEFPLLGKTTDCVAVQAYEGEVDLEVVKSADKASIKVGDEATYTITVTNGSGVPVSGFTVIDQIATAGASYEALGADPTLFSCLPPLKQATPVTIACTYVGPPLAANGTASFTVTVKAVDGGLTQIANSATVAPPKNVFDVDVTNNKTPTVTVQVLPVADLSIVKTGPPSATAGVEFPYTLTVQNTGPSTATGVIITDTVPPNTEYSGKFFSKSKLTCDPTPKSAGQDVLCWPNNANKSLTVNDGPQIVQINFGPLDTLSIDNVAKVKANEFDNAPANNSWEAITPVTPVANLTITKTTPNGPNEKVFTNDQVTYTIAVKNSGPSTATNVVVTDTLPGGMGPVSSSGCDLVSQVAPWTYNCHLGDIKPNGQASGTITVLVLGGFDGTAVQLDNTATVTEYGVKKQATASIVATPKANVVVTKVAKVNGQPVGSVPVNGTLTYEVTATNMGPSTAKNLSVQDTLPPASDFKVTKLDDACVDGNPVTCAIPSLSDGASKTFTIVGTPLTGGTTITNKATAVYSTFPNTSNTASIDTIVSKPGQKASKGSAAASYKGSQGGQFLPFTLPATLSAEAADATGTAIVYSVTLDDGTPESCTPASGFPFPIGTTAVTCSATDATGTTSNDTFTVVVRDTTPPSMALPGASAPQHQWTFNAPPAPTSGALDLSAGVLFDSGFGSAASTAIVHTGVAFTTRSVCSAGVPGGGAIGALRFDGSSDSLADLGAGVGQFGTNDFAISLWVRGPDPVPFAPADIVLLSNRAARGGGFFELRLTTAGAVAFELNDGGANDVIAQGAASLFDGAWHSIVVQRQGTDSSVFVDGALAATASSTGSATSGAPGPVNIANGNPLLMGGPSGGSQFAIDPLRIFTAVLSGDEIQRGFAAGSGDGTCGATEAVLSAAATSDSGAVVDFGSALLAVDAVDTAPVVLCTNAQGSPVHSGDTFPGGPTVVTCMATDASGNVSRNSFTVMVKAQPTIGINDVKIVEGNSGTTNALFTVSLSAPTTQIVTVDFATADGTATAGSDYVAASGTLTFNPGETTKPLTVLVNGDVLYEPDETFVVNLSNPANTTIVKGQGIGTILNDDGAQPTLGITDVSVTEGNSGTTNATFTVSLSGPSGQTATVDYATADGTATAVGANPDYVATSGMVTFLPGETTKIITVLVIGDLLVEPNETFVVNLSNPVNTTLAKAQGLGTILNDDVTISINDVTVAEGNSGTTNAVFTVSLSAPTTQMVTVDFATADGTATAGSDYVPSSGTLTFNPGETTKTLTVLVNGDVLYEPDELFVVNLKTPVNATLAKITGVGTILNDDAVPTTTAIASSLNPSTVGQSVTLTTGVTTMVGNVGIPTGTVTFKADGLSLGAVSLDANGIAALTTSALTAGSHTITAEYGGDAKFGASVSNVLSQVVNCPPTTLSPSTVPDGVVGLAYNQTIGASGGVPPYTFAVTTGTLPTGVTLSSAGVLSGTPTTAGTFTFTVTASCANGCQGSQRYTIAVLTPTQVTSELISEVVAFGFRQSNSLLQNVIKSLGGNNVGAACNQLGAFINQVQAQSGKALTADEATLLIQQARDAMGGLACR